MGLLGGSIPWTACSSRRPATSSATCRGSGRFSPGQIRALPGRAAELRSGDRGRFWAGDCAGPARRPRSLVGPADRRRRLCGGASRVFDENRSCCASSRPRRHDMPWRVPASEVYLVVRAWALAPVRGAQRDARRLPRGGARRRTARSATTVASCCAVPFCEQPPLGLPADARARRGAISWTDDLVLGAAAASPTSDLAAGDPVERAGARLPPAQHAGRRALCRRREKKARSRWMRWRRKRRRGRHHSAPASFCEAGASSTSRCWWRLSTRAGHPAHELQYSEDTGQFQVIREQAGRFSDSIKLWSES